MLTRFLERFFPRTPYESDARPSYRYLAPCDRSLPADYLSEMDVTFEPPALEWQETSNLCEADAALRNGCRVQRRATFADEWRDMGGGL